MQEHKFASEFIKSAIPLGISEGVRSDLYAELETHINEKIKYFTEIGFDDETAEKKAIEEMGDIDDIRNNFHTIYHTSIIPAILFPIVYAVLSVFTMFFGFVYVTVYSGEEPTAITVFISALITLSIPLLMFKAYKKQNVIFLITAGVTCVLSFFDYIFTAGMYQPFAVAVAYIMPFFEELGLDYWFAFVGTLSLNILYAVLAFVWAYKCRHTKVLRNAPKKKKQIITEKRLVAVFALIIVFVTGMFTIKNGIVSENHFMTQIIYNKINESKSEKCYKYIDNTMSYNEIKEYLLDNSYTIYINGRLKDDAVLDDNGEFSDSDFEEIESFTDDGYKIITFEPKYSALNNRIVVPDTGDKPITFKTLDYGLDNGLIALGTVEKIEPYKFYESYDKLELGMTKEQALKAIDTKNSNPYDTSTVYRDGKTYESLLCYSDYPMGGNITEMYFANVYIRMLFEDDKLISASMSAMGEDDHYDYEEIGDKSMGDEKKLIEISNYGIAF